MVVCLCDIILSWGLRDIVPTPLEAVRVERIANQKGQSKRRTDLRQRSVKSLLRRVGGRLLLYRGALRNMPVRLAVKKIAKAAASITAAALLSL